MSRILAIGLAMALSGCLTNAKLSKTNETLCAEKNLYYAGLDLAPTAKKPKTRVVRCDQPETAEQRCAVETEKRKQDLARAHNREWHGPSVLVGFGYALFVIPGVILYNKWIDENQADYRDYVTKVAEASASCAPKAITH